MRRPVIVVAVALTSVALASTPAAAAPVTGSAGCGDAGRFIGFVAQKFGRAAVGTFVSTDATTNGPGAVAVGMNASKAARCTD